jgi:hypothetical protein
MLIKAKDVKAKKEPGGPGSSVLIFLLDKSVQAVPYLIIILIGSLS